MNKKLFVLLAAVLALFLVTISAVASPSENAVGDWFYHPRSAETEFAVAGQNTIIHAVYDSRWNGTFQGSEECMVPEEVDCAASVDYGKVIFHGTGRGNFAGWVEFPGVTVEGVTGSLEMRVNGTLPGPGSEWVGHWVITGGELHEGGLRGQGAWWGPGWLEVEGEWGVIHYSGNIHFEGK